MRYRSSSHEPRNDTDRRFLAAAHTLTTTLGEVIVEILILPLAILVGGGILWAVLTEVVYRLARVARRGWEDEGLALQERQSDELPNEPVL